MENTTLYSQNTLILDRRFPLLASKLYSRENVLRNQPSPYYFSKSRSGKISASKEEGNLTVSITSQIDPLAAARKMAEDVYEEKIGCFLLTGLALGYGAEELLVRMKADQKMIIVEPEWTLFFHQLKKINFSKVFEDKRVSLIVEEKATFQMDAVRILLWELGILNWKLLLHPAYGRLFPEFINNLIREFSNEKKKLHEETSTFFKMNPKLKEDYFINGQMKDLQKFFERIETMQKKRELNDVEFSYLFVRDLFKYRAYIEESAAAKQT